MSKLILYNLLIIVAFALVDVTRGQDVSLKESGSTRTDEKRSKQATNRLQTLHNSGEKYSDSYRVLGCYLDLIHLVCPVDKTISVTNATYGFYTDCSDVCCEPASSDCTGVVSEERPADWSALILSCNNRTTCAFQYKGGPVEKCSGQEVADYMSIDYKCLPDSPSSAEKVAFTAIPTMSRSYSEGDTVLFDNTLNNNGGHYDVSSSIFTCPVEGTYSFTLTAATTGNNFIHASIIYEGGYMATVFATSHENDLEQGSATTNFICGEGKTVHVEISGGSDNYLHHGSADSFRFSLFSGFLY